MIARVALVAAAVGLAAFAFRHHAPRPPIEAAAPSKAILDPGLGTYSSAQRRHRGTQRDAADLVVYVAGAIKTPGLYHLRSGDRYAQAVALAGGLTALADGAGVNLAARAGDGDEIYVPAVGERPHARSEHRTTRRHSATPPPDGSVDVNQADAGELATVPGIGRAIAQRIVELREREGSFASLDELLDVAGMTQTRLDRARPYLREL